jgi:hypothetical protein
MSDPQSNPSPAITPPPVPKNNSFDKIKWLLLAFIPAVFGIVCVSIKNMDSSWLPVFVVLDLICSIPAGVAVLRGIEPRGLRIFLTIFLMVAFFVLNASIVIFIGCAEYGI